MSTTIEDPQIQTLFEPGQIGRLTTKNRIVATPHAVSTVDGVPTAADVAYFAALAAGGFGLIIAGATIPHESSRSRGRNLTEAYARDAPRVQRARPQAVHDNGGRIFCQLVHLGRATLGVDTLHVPVAPSPVRSAMDPFPPKELTETEIDDIVEGFAVSARNLRDAGYDGIEISGCHGYLIAQFLSPATNLRTDSYGGSAEKRFLFLRRVIEGIRRTCGDGLPVGVRLSAPEETPGGLTVDDSIAIARQIDSLGAVDYLSITTGGVGRYVKDMSAPIGISAEAAGRIRAATKMKIIAGHRNSDIAVAARILADGQADFVGMVRALIADPLLPAKAKAGLHEDIRPCVVCVQDCRAFDGVLFCAVNPDTGRELLKVVRHRTPTRRRIAVVGAGPAGLEAARTAAAEGHEVVLFERNEAVGGQLAVASRGPTRAKLLDIITYLDRQVRRTVDVRLGTDFLAVAASEFDAVIAATGAAPGPLTGDSEIDAVRTFDILTGHAVVDAGRAVVLDDGLGYWPAISAVETLTERGMSVVLVSSALTIAHGVPYDSIDAVLDRFRAHKVSLRTNRSAEIKPDGVLLTDLISGEQELVAADLVAVETGRVAERQLLAELGELGAAVTAVGDCLTPRRLSHAIWEGRAAGLAVGAASP